MKACFAIHSILLPNNGLQARGLSLHCSRGPEQITDFKRGKKRKIMIKKENVENVSRFASTKGGCNDLMETPRPIKCTMSLCS